MTDLFVPCVGGVLSADIAVPEHEREVRFYSRILGTGDKPLWREDLMNNVGSPIIGLGERIPEYAELPLKWMPHIQVADVATSVERALAMGGSEVMHGKGENGESLWAALLDPSGAAFGIMPEVPAEAISQGDGSATEVGRIAWLDLTVSDAAGTRDFYREVVGWTAQEVGMEAAGETYSDFRMFSDDGNPVAGVRQARGANLDVPPAWILYLPVGDIAESVRLVGEEGGKVVHRSQGEAGEDSCVVIQDPVGVHIGLIPG